MHRIQPVEWKEIFILLNEFTVTDTFGFNITHAHLLVFLVFGLEDRQKLLIVCGLAQCPHDGSAEEE